MEKQEGYRIVKLHISNIKRIKAVDITPQKDLVIIEGDNANGKTSVMDSISYLLGGTRLIPKEPIRKGETEGFAQAIIGNFEVTRKWSNPYTSYLKIKTAEGMSPGNPQTFLNERIGSFSLEIAELMNMSKEERIAVFKRITGLNLDDLTKKHEKVMLLRYDENKTLARLKVEIKSYEDLPDIKEGLDIDELQKDRKEKEGENKKREDRKTGIDEQVTWKDNIEMDTAEAEEEIITFQKQIDDLKKGNEERAGILTEVEKTITLEQEKWESMVEWDLSEIDGKIKEAVEQQGLIVKLERKDSVKEEIEIVEKVIKKHNDNLDKIKDERTKRIKDSAVPVEGVQFDGETIRYKDIEFEECSTAERIEMSIAIGIKENPKIRILLIRDGSAIGKATMERIKELAKENNFQIWIERVSNTKGNEIYIEDGQIV